MEDIAERIVNDLEPSSGWWKGDTPETLKDVAVTLLTEGVDEDTVENCLHRTMSAIAEEYGD